jgi:hypothetical protein
MFLELLLFSSHIWMVFLTMEPSQEPCFQAPKNTFNSKVLSFVWVYVGLGWEHKELDGNKIISMGY